MGEGIEDLIPSTWLICFIFIELSKHSTAHPSHLLITGCSFDVIHIDTSHKTKQDLNCNLRGLTLSFSLKELRDALLNKWGS